MIKKCAVIGALGIAFGGVCLSEIENSKLKGTNTGMQQKDNFSHVKSFDLTGYVVGIHKSSNLIEVANVESKEEAIEFSEKDIILLIWQLRTNLYCLKIKIIRNIKLAKK
ncbi:hypothetical protein AAHB62_31220 [Bacillus cereus]